MPGYIPTLDVIYIDADGLRNEVRSANINVQNLSKAASLTDITTDAFGVIEEQELDGDPGDIVELSHDTYTLTARFVLGATQADAYLVNDVSTYIVENDYSTSAATDADIYIQAPDDVAPTFIGSMRIGEAAAFPYQTNIPHDVKVWAVTKTDDFLRTENTFIDADAVTVSVPSSGGSIFDAVDNATTTGTTAEDLYSHVIPANTFRQNGDEVRVTYRLNYGSNGNNKQSVVYVDANDIFDSGVLVKNGGGAIIEIHMIRSDSDTLKIHSSYHDNTTNLVQHNDITAVDFTADIPVVFNGTTSTQAGDMTLNSCKAIFIPAAPVPPWTPADLTQAVTRYKASEITGLADSDPVSTWADLIGASDATGTGSARPLYRTGSGDPYVSFDGTDDVLDTSITTAFTDFAVFIVFRLFNLTEAGTRVIDKKYDTGFWIGTDIAGAGDLGGGVREGSSPYGHFYTAAANTWYAMLFQRDGTTKTIRFAGNSNSETVSGTALDTTSMLIGKDTGAALYGQVDIKEIVICNDAVTDLTDLIGYALDTYGLTL